MTGAALLAAMAGTQSAPTHTKPPFVADTGRILNLADGCATLAYGWTPGPVGTAAATRHVLHGSDESLLIGWHIRPTGFGTDVSTGADPTAQFRAWWRRPGGVWEQIALNGAIEATLPADHAEAADPALNLESQPIAGPWHAGDVIEVAMWAAGSGRASAHGSRHWPGDLGVRKNVTAAQAVAGDFTPSTSQTPRPSYIIGHSRGAPSWLIQGDSILGNAIDPYCEVALRRRGWAFTSAYIHGDSAKSHVDTSRAGWEYFSEQQVAYCDSVMCALGRNDLGAGADAISWLRQLWQKFVAAGVERIVQVTITPRIHTTSDDWATAEGQNPLGFDDRKLLNDWLRDGAPIVDGIEVAPGTTDPAAVRASVVMFDGTVVRGKGAHPLGSGFISECTAAIETAVDSGRVRVDGPRILSDTVHITDYAHSLIAPVLERDLKLMGF